ncbi:MAG: hypothetical protein GWM98_08125, partial [Nitrospinaceae bacterium]|nr:glycosyltransferase family 9 protein [Nitrospinaceae bacterium]NIR54470.1 glycosyltransferase family 9 protein [Nitrospinaceae bacterium]NIS84889.1 glycosyltransferase family 9 protein [Nitrospinaceae bacterium]NIT81701.1 glycosyltransferase family 9 protein [Nitrospinaceae bacterium]NIU43972.1 glycosyltransferase family 9 protein [Nitrospinaceae bacterium]
MRLLFLLRRNRFDRVFVLHRAWQFNLLVALAGIPHRIGFARGNDRHLLTHPVPVVSSRNEREAYLDLLRTLNIPAVYERTFYYLSNEEKKFLDRFCRQNRIRPQTRVIGIAPGGGNNVKNSMPSRRWPASYFIELIRRIHQELPAKVVLFGGPDDRDVVERILKDCPEGLGAVD